MRAAIYTRVSQDRSGAAKSVASQEQECRELCDRNGWDLVKVYTDNDRSASRYASKGRPEFERLLQDLTNYDVLVTWEASRATRDLEVYVTLRAACREAKVKWAYSGKVYDFARTDDSFSTGLDMLIAERESGQTSDRINRVVRQHAQAGKPHGRIPFGYTREYDPSSGALVRQIPHPEESKVITEGARRVLAGETLYSIAKDFRERDMPLMGSNRWKPMRLGRLLRNPTYAAKRVYRGQIIGDAAWEPLVTVEQWEALNAILNAPDRLRFHGSEPQWLLTGVATCGVCGGGMQRNLNRGKYSTYICKEKMCVGRSQPKADAVVVAVVKQILSRTDALEAIHAEAEPDISGAAQDIRELEARLEGFYVQAAEGDLSPQGLAKVESSITAKLEAARDDLRALSTPQRITIDDPAGTADRWDELPLLDQRDIVRALMLVRIMPARARGARFDPESIEITQRF